MANESEKSQNRLVRVNQIDELKYIQENRRSKDMAGNQQSALKNQAHLEEEKIAYKPASVFN